MKKLLLILLCLPMIGFSEEKLYYNFGDYTVELNGGLYNKNQSKYYDWVDRDLMLYYENYLENNFSIRMAVKSTNPFPSLRQRIYNSRNDTEINHTLISDILNWNNEEIYYQNASYKDYGLTQLLWAEFEYSAKFSDYNIDIVTRSRRSFKEAKDEGTIYIFLLRRFFSLLPYLIYLIPIYFLYKRIRK